MAFQLCDFQLFDNNGDPLNGGKVYVYAPGTLTAKDSYPTADAADAATGANPNPVVLDSAGRPEGGQIWGVDGQSYKLVVKTSADVTLDTIDDIETPATRDEVKQLAPRLKVYTAGGTANALTITLDPAITALSTDVSFYFRPSAANTAAGPTIAIDGKAAATAKLADASTDVPAGFFQTGNVYGGWFDGTTVVIVVAPDIIESGNNANGYYVRHKDGTQECWHSLAATTTSGATGNVWFADAGAWTFPKAFSSTTGLIVQNTAGSGSGESWGGRVIGASTTGITATRGMGSGSTATFIAQLSAKGRWY